MPGKNSKGNPPEPGRVWNLEDIQQLLDLLAGKEITEFEMEQQGVKIRVLRGGVQPANSGNSQRLRLAPGGPGARRSARIGLRAAVGSGGTTTGRRGSRRRIHRRPFHHEVAHCRDLLFGAVTQRAGRSPPSAIRFRWARSFASSKR